MRNLTIYKAGGDLSPQVKLVSSMVAQNNGESRLVLSAMRGNRNEDGIDTTSVLIAAAQAETRESALAAIEQITNWTRNVPDIAAKPELQAAVDAWRTRGLEVFNRIFDEQLQIRNPNREDGSPSTDHLVNIDGKEISITGMGEALAEVIYRAILPNPEMAVSGYRPETGTRRGYSDHTAVLEAIEGAREGAMVEIVVLKRWACFDSDPARNSCARFVPEINGDEIRTAFTEGGYAHGVLQIDAVEALLTSGIPVTVWVQSSENPTQRTRIPFNQVGQAATSRFAIAA